jgi:hypothetical protein
MLNALDFFLEFFDITLFALSKGSLRSTVLSFALLFDIRFQLSKRKK